MCMVAQDLLLFNHIHLAVFFVVLIMVSMAFLFLVPTKLMSDRALHRDFVMNPLERTSLGIQLAFYQLFLHVSKSSSYLNSFFFCGPLLCSSHRTVNSLIIIFFVLFENISIFRLNNV